jgi:hypothetical protein
MYISLLTENRFLKKPALLLAFLFFPMSAQAVSANEWMTYCGRKEQERQECKLIRSEAILSGTKGTLYTIIFPDRDKHYYFYTGGILCIGFEGLMVKKEGGKWLNSSAYCTKNNRLVFKHPSGEVFFWISAFFE